jgi:hypothetical protein
MGAGRATTTAVAAVLGSVLAVVLLVTWAASIGPGGVLTGDGPATHRISPTQTTTSAQPSGSPTRGADRRRGSSSEGDHPVVRALLTVLPVGMALLLLAGLVRLSRAAWDRWTLRRRPPPPPPVIEFDVLETPRRVAEEIRRDAIAQRALLLEGSPRNAIVACWQRFEEQAARAGVVRSPWETSGEFTLRVLDLVAGSSAHVERLSELYREARFSRHPVDEVARQAAVTALDAIHAELEQPGVESR